jgi:hypothetical protein
MSTWDIATTVGFVIWILEPYVVCDVFALDGCQNIRCSHTSKCVSLAKMSGRRLNRKSRKWRKNKFTRGYFHSTELRSLALMERWICTLSARMIPDEPNQIARIIVNMYPGDKPILVTSIHRTSIAIIVVPLESTLTRPVFVSKLLSNAKKKITFVPEGICSWVHSKCVLFLRKYRRVNHWYKV